MTRTLGALAAVLAVALTVILLRAGRGTPASAGAPSGASAVPAADASPTAIQVPPDPSQVDAGSPEPEVADRTDQGEPAEADLPVPHGDDTMGCIVYGRVTDASGSPIEGGEGGERSGPRLVTFEDAAGETLQAHVGEEGAFSIAGLGQGRWIVSTGADGYRRYREPFDLSSGARSMRRDIALERAVQLRVLLLAPGGEPFFQALRDSGNSLPPGMDLQAVATAAPPGATFDADQQARLGRFRKSGFGDSGPPGCLGTMVLDDRSPAWISLVLESAVLATQRLEPDKDAVFTLDPERLVTARSALRVRLVEAESAAPIEGAEIFLIGQGMTSPTPHTDAQGVALIENQAPGTYGFWVQAPEREAARRSITLVPGETLDLGTLELGPGLTIAGRVVDAQGLPFKAMVQLGRVDPVTREVAMYGSQAWMSARDGTFKIGGLERGEFVVRSNGSSLSADEDLGAAAPNAFASTLGGSVSGLELAFVPTGRLLLRTERADWESLRYRVFDEQNLERSAGRIYERLQFAVTLPRGRYRLRVTDGAGRVVLEQPIAIGEEPLAIQLPED